MAYPAMADPNVPDPADASSRPAVSSPIISRIIFSPASLRSISVLIAVIGRPVGWVERQRNPSSFTETRAIVGRIARPIERADAGPDHEGKVAAADKVSPIVRHRASIARLKMMGFATFNPSYGLHYSAVSRTAH